MGTSPLKWPLNFHLCSQLPSDWPSQLLYAERETEAQPEIERSPEFEPSGPAIQPTLACGEFVAFPVLLAVEPREGRRKFKGRLSSSLSSKPGVLKTHTEGCSSRLTLDCTDEKLGPKDGQ